MPTIDRGYRSDAATDSTCRGLSPLYPRKLVMASGSNTRQNAITASPVRTNVAAPITDSRNSRPCHMNIMYTGKNIAG